MTCHCDRLQPGPRRSPLLTSDSGHGMLMISMAWPSWPWQYHVIPEDTRRQQLEHINQLMSMHILLQFIHIYSALREGGASNQVQTIEMSTYHQHQVRASRSLPYQLAFQNVIPMRIGIILRLKPHPHAILNINIAFVNGTIAKRKPIFQTFQLSQWRII